MNDIMLNRKQFKLVKLAVQTIFSHMDLMGTLDWGFNRMGAKNNLVTFRWETVSPSDDNVKLCYFRFVPYRKKNNTNKSDILHFKINVWDKSTDSLLFGFVGQFKSDRIYVKLEPNNQHIKELSLIIKTS